MNIYSKIEPTKILHIINRKPDIKDGRVELVETDQFIQCAALKHPSGKTFKAHRHIMQVRNHAYIPQESWVVISGLIQVTLYDIDNSVLHVDILEPGDISITLEGGHNYLFMEDSIVYEYKTGPYLGQEKDKTFL
jgi:hypothetical protein